MALSYELGCGAGRPCPSGCLLSWIGGEGYLTFHLPIRAFAYNRTNIRPDTVYLRPLELKLKPMQAPQDTKQKRGMDLDGRHGDWIAPSFRIAAGVASWPLRALIGSVDIHVEPITGTSQNQNPQGVSDSGLVPQSRGANNHHHPFCPGHTNTDRH